MRQDEVAFEAEDADKIEAPMEIVKDAKVSGGKYIKSPTGRAGWAEYEIEIPDDAKYYMWGMVQEHSGVTDSFFITFDLLDRGQDNDANVNTWDLGGPANTWVWDKVSGRGAGGDPRIFELSKGTHNLRVWTREEESWLDCLYMSTDQNAQPVLASEFKGRKRTSAPKSVTYIGKLAITWGRVKK
ncbi:TPA: hypothetical protein EYP66_09705 [Candidatus Poribacteria bacterium]|nr:hypothetical protein [Candidatus Poribacteria bacterium]